MAKKFTILSIDGARGCMLVRFVDGAKQHETEIALPPSLPAGAGDAELSEWIAAFWPQAQMEGDTMKRHTVLVGAVDRAIDITKKVPLPAEVSPKAT